MGYVHLQKGFLMKTLTKLLAFVFIFISFQTSANETETGPYLSIGQNWFNYDDDWRLDDESDLYFGAGYQFNKNWGVEAQYTDVDTTFLNTLDVSTKFYSVNAVYRYNPRSNNSFYWKAGLGKYSISRINESLDPALKLGAGYDFHFNDNISFTLGLDTHYQTDDSQLDWVPYAGFNIFFGGNKPAAVKPVKKAPLDSDRDGVYDNQDRCPTTQENVKVDSRGCALDSDKDGVYDSFDQCPTTPSGAKVDTKGCRVMLMDDVSIKLHVQFVTNSNVVRPAYHEEIKKVADFMRQYPDTTVVIEGHTDSRGAASYNQQLSQKRADAVMQYLVSQFNIEQSRVSADGKGEVSPIADNDTAEGREANRRVQAEIKTSVQKPQ